LGARRTFVVFRWLKLFRRDPLSIARLAVTVLLLSLAACSTVPASLPQAHELVVTREGVTAEYPQYWRRNTLLVDLQGVGGSGRIVLKPRQGGRWPVRIALRVTPGEVGVLEVYAEQRSILPITRDGSKPVELELDPGLYASDTEQIAVAWRPASL
jgi:hypothetical protein